MTTAQGLDDELPVTQVRSIQFAAADFRDTSAGILEFGDKVPTRCLAPQGLIGANLMRHAFWKIDYLNHELTISQAALTIPDDVVEYPFKHPVMSATPSIELSLNGKTISGVLFDTGFNGGLVLPMHLADEFVAPVTHRIADQSTSGIFGSNEDDLIVKQLELTLGGTVSSIPVEFSSLDKALLGNDLLEHFDVYIDYINDVITLDAQSLVEVDPPRTFIPGVTADDRWVVNRTTAASDLKLGQFLDRIKGLKPSDVYTDYCDYFLDEDGFLSNASDQSMDMTARSDDREPE